MSEHLYSDAREIYTYAITRSMPDNAVRLALNRIAFDAGRLFVIAVGKAAWQMASAAYQKLGSQITRGLVITKYGHSRGKIPRFWILEAGHPVPDANSFAAARAAMDLTEGLGKRDTVLFLLSGGGSALFEYSRLPLAELQDINSTLLKCGADIQEINTVRKHLSEVKGGRFALHCAPAQIVSIILSDVLGNRLDMIASGPTCADRSTAEEAQAVIKKYRLPLSEEAKRILSGETPKVLPDSRCILCGSAEQLVEAAGEMCRQLGYETHVLPQMLTCEAREAGKRFGQLARLHVGDGKRQAFLATGETVVHVTGNGLGGRNQEMALSAAEEIAGIPGILFLSVGSDGTDGPTDAAGGWVDGTTREKLRNLGFSIPEVLKRNDSYHALDSIHALIKTGPTGTNVNDLTVLLLDPESGVKKG